jgi:metal-dependent amidase/aminoacylase/carboxypeptidase family protein
LRETALGRLRDLLIEAESEFEIKATMDVIYETVPLFNDPNVTSTVLEVGRELIGERASLLGKPLTVSDDMAEFLTRVPGCYFMLGAKPPSAETPPAHHSPTFDIDESAFATGVRVLVGAATRLAGG